MLTFCVGPDIVIVDVPFVNTLPVPEVFHVPATVQPPLVSPIVPLDPPVIVTFVTVTVAWFPLTIPPLFTVRLFDPKAKYPVFPAVSVSVPVTLTAPPAVMVPVVMLHNVPDPIVIAPTVKADVELVIPPVPARDTAAPPVML
jgi:hypothetical protein